jgi:molybdopterin-guanine dinucleotide biosynthesis protein A
MINTPCVIFAGGKSSRMGEDKSLLPFAGYETLIEFQYTRLSKIFSNVYISCKESKQFNFPAKFIYDIDSDAVYAPTLGFVTVFQELNCETFFALSVDAPFVDFKTIEKLFSYDKPINDATIAKTASGIQPMCGIYHNSLLHDFTRMLETNQHRLGYLLKSKKTTFVPFENETIFLNLNHPHEYQQALKLLSS